MICIPYNKEEATSGNGNMVMLKTDSRQVVDALYIRTLQLGALDEGQPGVRLGGKIYAAYIRDPDGNKIGFMCYQRT